MEIKVVGVVGECGVGLDTWERSVKRVEGVDVAKWRAACGVEWSGERAGWEQGRRGWHTGPLLAGWRRRRLRGH